MTWKCGGKVLTVCWPHNKIFFWLTFFFRFYCQGPSLVSSLFYSLPLSLVSSTRSEASLPKLVSLLIPTFFSWFYPSLDPHCFSVFRNDGQWIWPEILAELEKIISRSVPSQILSMEKIISRSVPSQILSILTIDVEGLLLLFVFFLSGLLTELLIM